MNIQNHSKLDQARREQPLDQPIESWRGCYPFNYFGAMPLAAITQIHHQKTLWMMGTDRSALRRESATALVDRNPKAWAHLRMSPIH